ncbi:type VI secretion system Vgr family protein, partial [Achromobacter arsenitoxydans SY8]
MASENIPLLNQARTVQIRGAGLPSTLGRPMLRFRSLEGRERMGQLFTYEVLLRTPNSTQMPLSVSANVDLKDMIGKELTVTIQLSDGTGREITGLVVKAGFVRQDGDHNLYRVILRPWLWLATLTTDYKIFQDQSVVEIIDSVLKDYPYPVDKRLDIEKYAILPESLSNEPRNFQVQYGETDFDFIQRLMEEWGIYWFFEHSGGTHRLVLCDHVGAHRPPDSPAYQDIAMQAEGGRLDVDVFHEFGVDERLFPGRVVVDDFDFTRPRMPLATSSHQPRETSWAEGEIYEWPGDYTDAKHGALISRVRMEERRARGVRSHGYGNVRGLAAGQTFFLTEHLYERANREYLVLASDLVLNEIEEESGGSVTYECVNQMEVQPTEEVFRMPRTLPKPVVSGPQSAIVVGPPGQEVWTDEFGRVKVRFLWDRYARNDASDSCWVRVNQAWAGSNFGGMYIPRIGQEVVISFMNGDPDRPIILGGLYNSVTRPPWDLPGEATKSGIKTRSLEGGRENYNGLRFEDRVGAEEFYMQAEREMVTLTKGNESRTVALSLGMLVGLNHNECVGGMLSSTVVGAASYNVGLAHSTQVGGACALNVGGAYAVNVGAAVNFNVGAGYLLNAGAAVSITCGKSAINMLHDGTIKIIGKAVEIVGAEAVKVKGTEVHLDKYEKKKDKGALGFGMGLGVPPVVLPDIPKDLLAGLKAGLVLPLPLPGLPPSGTLPPVGTPTPPGTPTPTPPGTTTPTPTPTETPTPTPTETPPPTPTETPPPTPTETPPPTPTETPPPTPTDTPTPTPTETPPPTPTETPPPTPTENTDAD